MSRIGVKPADAASSTMPSIPTHEYPGDVGSAATKPLGRVAGGAPRHETSILTYLAPAERVIANALARCELLKSDGSTRAVASGAVPGVEYVAAPRATWARCFTPAMPADTVAPARHRTATPIAR
jgi:hypothetical protein